MIHGNNLQIVIRPRLDEYSVEIWLHEDTATASRFINLDGDHLMVTVVENGMFPEEELKPFLKLPTQFANALFKAISDYNSEQGIKTKDENLLEGKLQATEVHLKDMREFSKKLLQIQLNSDK